MRCKDPLLRCAARLSRCYEARDSRAERRRDTAIDSVSAAAAVIRHHAGLRNLARAHGWAHAVQRLEHSIANASHIVQTSMPDPLRSDRYTRICIDDRAEQVRDAFPPRIAR